MNFNMYMDGVCDGGSGVNGGDECVYFVRYLLSFLIATLANLFFARMVFFCILSLLFTSVICHYGGSHL